MKYKIWRKSTHEYVDEEELSTGEIISYALLPSGELIKIVGYERDGYWNQFVSSNIDEKDFEIHLSTN